MPYISTAATAAILGVTPNAVLYRIERGQLTPYCKDGSPWRNGKRIYFDEEAIQALKETPPEPDGREWLPVDAAAEFLGMNRLSVFKLGRDGKLLSRKVIGDRPRNGRRSFEFERESLEAYRQRMVRTPPPEEASEWMPIAEAMKALKMTRPGVKRRIKMGLLGRMHYGPPEAEALYVRRSQVEEQVLQRPSYARQTEWQEIPATEIELAWAGGFFAGEGCIVIRLTRGTNHTLNIGLANSCEDDVRQLESTLGGRVYDRPRQKAHYRDQWRWQANGDEAGAILKRLLPYLGGKRKQAALAIEFQDRVARHTYSRWDPMSPEEFGWRAAQKERISRLNRPNVLRETP